MKIPLKKIIYCVSFVLGNQNTIKKNYVLKYITRVQFCTFHCNGKYKKNVHHRMLNSIFMKEFLEEQKI
jgi:hypothetical protein